ncbi:hypothetical protein N9O65_02255 [Schleiferiaceae bacterium]|nr:hypothetical protein [Schleiferiaceae bacterium]
MLIRTLLVSIYILISSILRSQSLSINYLESRVEINETHLLPPQTAGADYAASIPLDQGAFVSVQGVRSRTNWCLLAYHTEPLQGSATLKISPDITSVPPENIGTNTPAQLILQGQPQPLFSGTGPVDQLFLSFTLEHAHVSQNVNTTPVYIQYQLLEGCCPPGP